MLANELPPCDGPKLQAFKYRNAGIEWLDLLNKIDEWETPGQGYVFKVNILSRVYALKVVCCLEFSTNIRFRYYISTGFFWFFFIWTNRRVSLSSLSL